MRFLKAKYIFSLFFLVNCLISQESIDSVCPTVGLVLSGGGAKGFAHIGALKVLEENNIFPDRIGGTSMGAIVGGLYASGYNSEELDSIVHNIDLNKTILSPRNRKLIPFFDKNYAEKYILQIPFDNFKLKMPHAISKDQGANSVLTSLTRHVHDVTDFEELSTPFYCIATDLETGDQVILDKGSLAHSVLASGAFPTLVSPQEIGGKLLVDGGIVNNFPAKEMKFKGVDVVIGVDVQEDNINRENLKSITKLLEQVATLKSNESLKKQKEYTDVFINANIDGYGVTDFDARDEIITRGIVATKSNLENIFKLIPEYCRTSNEKRLIRHNIHAHDSLIVTTIEVNGADRYTSDYLLDKIKIDVPKKISNNEIVESEDRLYATGNFSKIDYLIKDDLYGKRIVYQLEEEKNKMLLKFGLHYDSQYHTGFLTNLTAKNVLFKNSFLSTDVILGDKLRFNVNYLIDNGIKPSFGINYSYKDVEFENSFDRDRSVMLEYDFRNNNLQAFIQSIFFDRYALGAGVEFDNIDISYNNTLLDNNLANLGRHNYFGPYVYAKIDNRDKPVFSREGIKVDAKYKWILANNDESFDNNSYLKVNSEFNFVLDRKLTLKLNGGIGITFSDDDLPFGQQFYLGGFNEQSLVNYQKLYGYEFMNIRDNNYFMSGINLQYNLLKNHYVSAIANYANTSRRIEDLKLFDFSQYNGYGIQYGYNSPLGPMILNYSYSPSKSNGELYISLGFWF